MEYRQHKHNTTKHKSTCDIPPSGSFTANYKGHFTSAQSDAFTSNGQRKIVLDSQGKYHIVYPSYGKIWSTQSNNTDFNGVWSNEIIFAEESDLQLKNPSIDDFDGYASATVYEGGMNGFAGIFLAEKYLLNNDIPVISQIPETGIDPNYFGNIKPVVAYTAHEIFVVYKPSSSSPLKYWRKYYNGGQWLTEGPLNLPTTNQYSLNPSIVGDNSDNLHIVWQQSNSSIRYLHSYVSGVPYGNRYFEPNSYNVSTGAGYSTNEYPSVSLTDFNQAIISWKAGRHENPSKVVAGEETDLIWVSRVLVRPFWITSGGDFYAAGLNVNYSNNNSTTENGVTNSVIAYSQNNGESCRWIKRTAFGYTAAGSFNENGIQVQLSHGGNFSQIKAVVFENATAPFQLQKSNTNFLSKITSLEPGYSRTGVVRKEEAEFVFSFGDLRLDGENILFIEKSDTLPIPGVSEFNQYFRTENFYIDHTSQL